MKTIKVIGCLDCPFCSENSLGFYYCNVGQMAFKCAHSTSRHNDCPLNNEEVTVKVEEETR